MRFICLLLASCSGFPELSLSAEGPLTIDSESWSESDYESWLEARDRITRASGLKQELEHEPCRVVHWCVAARPESEEISVDWVARRVSVPAGWNDPGTLLSVLLDHLGAEPSECLDGETVAGVCRNNGCSRFEPESCP